VLLALVVGELCARLFAPCGIEDGRLVFPLAPDRVPVGVTPDDTEPFVVGDGSVVLAEFLDIEARRGGDPRAPAAQSHGLLVAAPIAETRMDPVHRKSPGHRILAARLFEWLVSERLVPYASVRDRTGISPGGTL
jgi:hypothetical protein